MGPFPVTVSSNDCVLDRVWVNIVIVSVWSETLLLWLSVTLLPLALGVNWEPEKLRLVVGNALAETEGVRVALGFV